MHTTASSDLWQPRIAVNVSALLGFIIHNRDCIKWFPINFHLIQCFYYASANLGLQTVYFIFRVVDPGHDKLCLNKFCQTTITERKQLRKKWKSSNKIQNLWNKVGLSEFKAV